MGAKSEKFLPPPTPISRRYWEACRQQQLLIQHCPACGHYQFYPRSVCTKCMGNEPQWVQASGFGTVETWTIVRLPVSEAYAADTPYVIALIRLDEGPAMMSRVTDCGLEAVKSGMPVEVVFEAWTEEVTMPCFRPRQAAD